MKLYKITTVDSGREWCGKSTDYFAARLLTEACRAAVDERVDPSSGNGEPVGIIRVIAAEELGDVTIVRRKKK